MESGRNAGQVTREGSQGHVVAFEGERAPHVSSWPGWTGHRGVVGGADPRLEESCLCGLGFPRARVHGKGWRRGFSWFGEGLECLTKKTFFCFQRLFVVRATRETCTWTTRWWPSWRMEPSEETCEASLLASGSECWLSPDLGL